MSFNVTVNQSNRTVSGQVIRYHRDSWLPAVTVNVCASVDVRDGEVEPTRAAPAPPCTGVLTATVVPVVVQPDSPDSKPPLTTAGGGGAGAAGTTTSSMNVRVASPVAPSSWLSSVSV